MGRGVSGETAEVSCRWPPKWMIRGEEELNFPPTAGESSLIGSAECVCRIPAPVLLQSPLREVSIPTSTGGCRADVYHQR